LQLVGVKVGRIFAGMEHLTDGQRLKLFLW